MLSRSYKRGRSGGNRGEISKRGPWENLGSEQHGSGPKRNEGLKKVPYRKGFSTLNGSETLEDKNF
jgi:hypothetical protein